MPREEQDVRRYKWGLGRKVPRGVEKSGGQICLCELMGEFGKRRIREQVKNVTKYCRSGRFGGQMDGEKKKKQ